MDGWKWFTVTLELSWMDGGTCCDGTILMKVHAKSEGQAISRCKDQIEHIGSHEVEEATAKLED